MWGLVLELDKSSFKLTLDFRESTTNTRLATVYVVLEQVTYIQYCYDNSPLSICYIYVGYIDRPGVEQYALKIQICKKKCKNS